MHTSEAVDALIKRFESTKNLKPNNVSPKPSQIGEQRENLQGRYMVEHTTLVVLTTTLLHGKKQMRSKQLFWRQ